MTTVINNPNSGESTGGGMILGGVLVLIVLLGLVYYFGFPRKGATPAPTPGVQVDLNLPSSGNSQGNQ